ncbi:MAG: GDP-mannose 4,6-dehydratase [Fimbriiglobus sp.]|jgi:GDP-4-dehydro-6-deoxy-D-mannose reductase|nr:GDP-mannose 4,6-dehydratase [Fimbriiglobus sp.]
MRVLITGISGFIGGHLTELLLAEGGHTVVGLSRSDRWPPQLAHLSRVDLRATDLTDAPAVRAILEDVRPDWIFHLAGYANPTDSRKHPDDCFRDNLTATRTLYDSIAAVGLSPRVLFASTGLMYAPAVGGTPLTEDAPLLPTNPYTQSKAEADALSGEVFRTRGLPVVRIRLFTQIGPRQFGDYAVARFAEQVAAFEAGRAAGVNTYDLSGYRDLTDVRDMVRACRQLVEKGTPGEAYNAGNGQAWRMSDVLDRLLALTPVRPPVHTTPDPKAPADPPVNRADTSKLRAATGWQPLIPLEQSLRDVLDWWRSSPAP